MSIIKLDKQILHYEILKKNTFKSSSLALTERKYDIEKNIFNKNKKNYLKNKIISNFKHMKGKFYYKGSSKTWKNSQINTKKINKKQNISKLKTISIRDIPSQKLIEVSQNYKIFKNKNNTNLILENKTRPFNYSNRKFKQFYYKRFLIKKINKFNFNNHFNNVINKQLKILKNRFLRRNKYPQRPKSNKHKIDNDNFHFYLNDSDANIIDKKIIKLEKKQTMYIIKYKKKSKSCISSINLYTLNNIYGVFKNKVYVKNKYIFKIVCMKMLKFCLLVCNYNKELDVEDKTHINNIKLIKNKIQMEKKLKLIFNIFKVRKKLKSKKTTSVNKWQNIINYCLTRDDLLESKLMYYDIKKIKINENKDPVNIFYDKISYDLNYYHNHYVKSRCNYNLYFN